MQLRFWLLCRTTLYALFWVRILQAVWIDHLILVCTALSYTSFDQEHNHIVLDSKYLPERMILDFYYGAVALLQ